MRRMPLALQRSLPVPWSRCTDRSAAVAVAVVGIFAAALLCALLLPLVFWLPLAVAASAGIAVLAFRHTVLFCVAWLLIAGATLEMTLHPLRDRPGLSPTVPECQISQWLNAEWYPYPSPTIP
jgi:hypothetical protein